MNKRTSTLAVTVIVILIVGGVTLAGGPPKPGASVTPIQISFDFPVAQYDEEQVLATYSVPSGKHLVIEFASIFAQFPISEGLVVFIETSVGGVTAKHYLTTEESWSNAQIAYAYRAGIHELSIFADPGTTVTVVAKLLTGCTDGDCPVVAAYAGAASGYLVESVIIQ